MNEILIEKIFPGDNTTQIVIPYGCSQCTEYGCNRPIQMDADQIVTHDKVNEPAEYT